MPLSSRNRVLLLLWALASAVLLVVCFGTARATLSATVEAGVLDHLNSSLDEALFSSAGGRTNDLRALTSTGRRINADLAGLVHSRWYAPLRECRVALREIDGVTLVDGPTDLNIATSLHRNQIERPLQLGVNCDTNYAVAAGLVALPGLLLLALAWLLPPALAPVHLQWLQRLQAAGCDPDRALAAVGGFSAAQLELDAAREELVGRLLASHPRAADRVLQIAADRRVAALGEVDLEWLVLGLADDLSNLDAALALAEQPDAVVINLSDMTLTARGVPVPVSKTPLFYYAWYAQKRLAGEGWVANPASNRPDLSVGAELAALMAAHGGHGRAINDLEQHGLKARTLDQNRSKLKDEIVACLGEVAAQAYLFEASRESEGVQSRYRLALEKARIRLVE